jgi:hypothetical protein
MKGESPLAARGCGIPPQNALYMRDKLFGGFVTLILRTFSF